MDIVPNNIYLGDCMKLMQHIPDASIDLILCDLPYGITSCAWDKKLSSDDVFRAYNRIIKDNGAIVLTATCKFAYELIHANKKYFRYDLGIEKMKRKPHKIKVYQDFSEGFIPTLYPPEYVNRYKLV